MERVGANYDYAGHSMDSSLSRLSPLTSLEKNKRECKLSREISLNLCSRENLMEMQN